jgi:hypothetical protein
MMYYGFDLSKRTVPLKGDGVFFIANVEFVEYGTRGTGRFSGTNLTNSGVSDPEPRNSCLN